MLYIRNPFNKQQDTHGRSACDETRGDSAIVIHENLPNSIKKQGNF